jgi:hypothetical protein
MRSAGGAARGRAGLSDLRADLERLRAKSLDPSKQSAAAAKLEAQVARDEHAGDTTRAGWWSTSADAKTRADSIAQRQQPRQTRNDDDQCLRRPARLGASHRQLAHWLAVAPPAN